MNMKRCFFALICFVSILLLSACGARQGTAIDFESTADKTGNSETEPTTKDIFVYTETKYSIHTQTNYEPVTTEDGIQYFEVLVYDVNDDTIWAYVKDGYYEYNSYKKVSFKNLFSHDVKIKDAITIYYSGRMKEISPSIPVDIYKLTTVDENGQVIEAYPED